MKVRKSKVPTELSLSQLTIPSSVSDVSTQERGVLASPSKSLGIGVLSLSGHVEKFLPSPHHHHHHHHHHHNKHKGPRGSGKLSFLERIEKASPVVFKRALSSFIRVADLNIDESATNVTDGDSQSEQSFPNFHRVSSDPPPGVDADPNELWIALDNGEGEHAPIAPMAVTALAKSGLFSVYDASMWSPEGRTAKLIKTKEHAWHACTWEQSGKARLPEGLTEAAEKEVLVWSGNFTHGRYGSELPAIRSAGLIHMPAKDLMELLVDSSRAKEYNKMSLGRTDLLVLQESLEGGGPFGGITKVMRSETKPPMVRKTLSFTSILHCRKLDDDDGYKLVSRAVTSPVDSSLAGTLQSEILLSVNIIKKVEGNDDQCLMLTVNHIRSPMVPMMIAKRIGLSAAVNFINDLRACAAN